MTETPSANLKKWLQRSRAMEARSPERYISSYGHLRHDDKNVWMTRADYETILQSCGRYDGTWPTGEYCGKMFVRGTRLCWFGIDYNNPTSHIRLNSREILITPDGGGPVERPPA